MLAFILFSFIEFLYIFWFSMWQLLISSCLYVFHVLMSTYANVHVITSLHLRETLPFMMLHVCCLSTFTPFLKCDQVSLPWWWQWTHLEVSKRFHISTYASHDLQGFLLVISALKPKVWFCACRLLNSLKSTPRLVGFHAHAVSVTQVTVLTSTPERCHVFRRLHSHPFMDGIAIECNEVDRGSKDDEVMQDNMKWCKIPCKCHKIYFHAQFTIDVNNHICWTSIHTWFYNLYIIM